MPGPFSVRIQTSCAVTANSYASGTFSARGMPCGTPQLVIGSGNRPFLMASMFFRYSASYSAVYGGRSRTPGSPARPFFGSTVAVSKTVGPIICHAPLQSGSAACCPSLLAAASAIMTTMNPILFFIKHLVAGSWAGGTGRPRIDHVAVAYRISDVRKCSDVASRILIQHHEICGESGGDPAKPCRLSEASCGRCRQRRENLLERHAGGCH